MANDPKDDLIYAIMTMDSYSRGYGTGITDLLESGNLGLYFIREFGSDEQIDWFDTGFYGIAYKKGGEVVIAFRGTDVKFPGIDSSTMGGNDPQYGYGIALGRTDTAQGVLAAQLYTAVAGNADGVADSNVMARSISVAAMRL